MQTTRKIAAASLTALLLLGACGGDDSPSSPSTTAGGRGTTTSSAAATTTSTGTAATSKSGEALRAALLTVADVPGATVATSSPNDFDLSTCVSGNTFAAKSDPSEVKSPGLELTEGAVNRQFGSKARQGTPEQAKAFVTAFASPSVSACVLDAFKAFVGQDPTPPKVDASGLTGTATAAAVADGGGVLSIKGDLKVGTDVASVDSDLLVFQKGSVVVFVSVSAVGGPKAPGKSLELARKIAGRLS